MDRCTHAWTDGQPTQYTPQTQFAGRRGHGSRDSIGEQDSEEYIALIFGEQTNLILGRSEYVHNEDLFIVNTHLSV